MAGWTALADWGTPEGAGAQHFDFAVTMSTWPQLFDF